ncbi:carboxypeptidase regulatory-like domain-containing protein [bacterium]|nr:carboxypeptidase regulatory-like domain-containing protein [bacterium]
MKGLTAIGLMVALLLPGMGLAASLSGTVNDIEGAPLEGARVAIHSGHGGGGHGGGMMGDYEGWTDAEGTYTITGVNAGTYEVRAMLMGYVMEEVELTFMANDDLTQDFALASSGGGGGGHGGGMWDHGWEEVELSGTAMVEANPMHDFIYLDVDADESADYLLGFGPPNYIPEDDISLPVDGDQIDITGGLMTHGGFMMDEPMVMVFTLNGEAWFTPDSSGHHNGTGGGWHDDHGCEYGTPELVGVEGYTLVNDGMIDHNHFWLNIDEGEEPEYRLDFGRDDYTPDNGAQRPEDGDWVEIVGGLIEGCPTTPTVVVYEINGMFWREPGDTTGLGPQPTTSVDEDLNPVSRPAEHLLVDAYPNPFNPTLTVQTILPSAQTLYVAVYDLLGREVATLADGSFGQGIHSFTFNGSELASGVYLLQVKGADEHTHSQRVVLVK